MAMVAAPPSGPRSVSVFRIQHRRKPPRRFAFAVMKDRSATSSEAEKEEHIAGDLRSSPRFPQLEVSSSQPYPVSPQFEASSGRSSLRFDRLQPSDDEFDCEHIRVFDQFVAREALTDEEFWAAAWLRAESHWEDRSDVRHVEACKRQFAEQEFNSLKRRCSRQHAEKCVCIVVVKKDEENVKHTVLSGIVGTLDLNILLYGETFPREGMKPPAFSNIYQVDQPKCTYVANLCVAKHARRQGIATNMLLLAIEAAISYGTNLIFIHVNTDNTAAQKLYDQIGFQMVKNAVPRLLEEDKYLLCLKI